MKLLYIIHGPAIFGFCILMAAGSLFGQRIEYSPFDIQLSSGESHEFDLRNDEAFSVQLRFEAQQTTAKYQLHIKDVRQNKVVLTLDNHSMHTYNQYTCYLKPGVYSLQLESSEDYSIKVVELLTHYIDVDPMRSQCGPTDDRVLSNDQRIARLSVGCTAQLLSNGTAACSGHCFPLPGGAFIEFNVPLSNPNGSNNPADPEDQYPVVNGSGVSQDIGCNGDWGIFQVGDNAVTGLSVFEAQAYFRPTNLYPNTSFNIRITGYGNDFDDPTRDNVQQTHSGPNNGSVILGGGGIILTYEADTEGGNSGSPIQRLSNPGFTYGIHNWAGCDGGVCTNDDENSGMSFNSPVLEAAFNDYWGSLTVHVDHTSNTSSETGSAFAPMNTFTGGINVSSSGSMNTVIIVEGTYQDANNTLVTKPVFLRAPVGDVIIR